MNYIFQSLRQFKSFNLSSLNQHITIRLMGADRVGDPELERARYRILWGFFVVDIA